MLLVGLLNAKYKDINNKQTLDYCLEFLYYNNKFYTNYLNIQRE